MANVRFGLFVANIVRVKKPSENGIIEEAVRISPVELSIEKYVLFSVRA